MNTKSILLAAALCAAQPLAAQLPTTSTADAPAWYYITGHETSDGRDGRVLTAENGKVFGRVPLAASADTNAIATQLWRFEQADSRYIIVNKATNQKIDIAYDAAKDISYATLKALSASSVATFELPSRTGGYGIKASAPAAGGGADKLNMHQANDYDSRGYVLMFESNTYITTFTFTEYVRSVIEFSTDTREVWYAIGSANPAYAGKYITDASAMNQGYINFSMEDREPFNGLQLWKLVKAEPTDMSDTALVHIVGRAYGNILQNYALPLRFFDHPTTVTEPTADPGWRIRYIGGGQYEIAGADFAGTLRHLYAAACGDEQPDIYAADDAHQNTAFAWRFVLDPDGASAAANTYPVAFEPCRLTVEDTTPNIPSAILPLTDMQPLRAFPNPTTGELIIDNAQLAIGAGSKVEVYNLQGVRLICLTLGAQRPQYSLNLASLSAGAYFVRVGNRLAKVIKR